MTNYTVGELDWFGYQTGVVVLVDAVGLVHALGPVSVALELLALELIASANDELAAVLHEHAHKVKTGLFGGSLSGYILVIGVDGALHERGVYVVAAGDRLGRRGRTQRVQLYTRLVVGQNVTVAVLAAVGVALALARALQLESSYVV